MSLRNVCGVSGDTLFLVQHNTEVLVQWDIYIYYLHYTFLHLHTCDDAMFDQ